MAESTTPALSEYDLTTKLVSHLDRHLIFPLLQFSAEQLEDDETTGDSAQAKARAITQQKFELLQKTNMTDYVADLYCDLRGVSEPPAEFAEKREKVLSQLEQYEQQTTKIRDLLATEEVVSNFRSDKVANLEFLKKDHGVRGESRPFWARTGC